VMLLVLYLVTC